MTVLSYILHLTTQICFAVQTRIIYYNAIQQQMQFCSVEYFRLLVPLGPSCRWLKKKYCSRADRPSIGWLKPCQKSTLSSQGWLDDKKIAFSDQMFPAVCLVSVSCSKSPDCVERTTQYVWLSWWSPSKIKQISGINTCCILVRRLASLQVRPQPITVNDPQRVHRSVVKISYWS